MVIRNSTLKPTGKRAARWAVHHKKSRAAVVRRARGLCEAGCGKYGIHWHHLFGRRFISEPLASLPCFTTLLCFDDHQLIHHIDGAFLDAQLGWMGVDRAKITFGIFDAIPHDWTHVDAARHIERVCKNANAFADLTPLYEMTP